MRAESDAPLDDPGERLDELDERGLSTGRTVARGEAHARGLWHRALHLWVVREGRFALLQRRDRRKRFEGGRVDATVAGHLGAGETLPDALREAEEEVGLELRPGVLTYLGTWRSERRYPDALDRELQEAYVLRDERELPDYVLPPRGEVEGLYEAPLEGLLELLRGERRSLYVAGFDRQRRVSDALLTEDDLIAQARGVQAEQLERVRAWLAGEAWEPHEPDDGRRA